jgi:periplasmic divalent cation tolerance protein
MTDKIVILCTCASEEEAERLARSLLDARLAACVNVLPRARSFYRWKGAVESAEESLMIIKTSRGLFEQARILLETAHSYELPEVLALPVVDGAETYLAWIDSNLQGGTESK